MFPWHRKSPGSNTVGMSALIPGAGDSLQHVRFAAGGRGRSCPLWRRGRGWGQSPSPPCLQSSPSWDFTCHWFLPVWWLNTDIDTDTDTDVLFEAWCTGDSLQHVRFAAENRGRSPTCSLWCQECRGQFPAFCLYIVSGGSGTTFSTYSTAPGGWGWKVSGMSWMTPGRP